MFEQSCMMMSTTTLLDLQTRLTFTFPRTLAEAKDLLKDFGFTVRTGWESVVSSLSFAVSSEIEEREMHEYAPLLVTDEEECEVPAPLTEQQPIAEVTEECELPDAIVERKAHNVEKGKDRKGSKKIGERAFLFDLESGRLFPCKSLRTSERVKVPPGSDAPQREHIVVADLSSWAYLDWPEVVTIAIRAKGLW